MPARRHELNSFSQGCVATFAIQTIGDKIVQTLYSSRVTSENIRIHTPSPLPSIQSWDVSCFLKVARTVAQHCMEGMGEEKLSFSLSKSGKRQKVLLGRGVSTHFVADCSLWHRLCLAILFICLNLVRSGPCGAGKIRKALPILLSNPTVVRQ